jgi:hypothetical protein
MRESGLIVDMKFSDCVVVQRRRERKNESALTAGMLVKLIEEVATLFRPWSMRR